jgi:hypothetical protein
MSFEFLKIVVQPVIIERDKDGQIVGERLTESVSLYSLEALPKFVETVKQSLEEENAKAARESLIIPNLEN